MPGDVTGVQYWLEFTDPYLNNIGAFLPLESHRTTVVEIPAGGDLLHVLPVPGS